VTGRARFGDFLWAAHRRLDPLAPDAAAQAVTTLSQPIITELDGMIGAARVLCSWVL